MNQRFQEQHEYSRGGGDRPRDQYGHFESDSSSRSRTRGREYEDSRDEEDRYEDGRSRRFGAGQDQSRDEHGRFESSGRSRAGDGSQEDRPRDQYGRFESEGDRSRGFQTSQGRSRDEDGRFESEGSRTSHYYESDRMREGNGRHESSSSSRSGGQGRSMESPRGQFAGKGPKGYKRSDDRIEEDVNEALTHDSQLDASEIEVKVQNGVVTLSGTVYERRFKRMAEDIAEQCSGVQDVRNEIQVRRESDGSGGEKSKSSTTATAKSA